MLVFLLAAIVCGFALSSVFMKGLILGAAMVAAPMSVWVIAVQVTGSAPVMMGDEAEQWTAQELRRLTRRGWRLVNHLALAKDDIDHVLIGPGGAFAIETKWSGSSWDSAFGRTRQEEAIAQVATNARSLRLWHPFKSQDIPVSPVVVLWGRGISRWPGDQHVRVINDVTVLAGRPGIRAWTETLGVDTLEEPAVDHAWSAMDAHATRRDPIDAITHPVPTSLAEWFTRGGLALASAVGALMAFNAILQRSDSTPLTLGAAVIFTVPAVIIARSRISPLPTAVARAWTATLILLSTALVVAEVAYRLA